MDAIQAGRRLKPPCEPPTDRTYRLDQDRSFKASDSKDLHHELVICYDRTESDAMADKPPPKSQKNEGLGALISGDYDPIVLAILVVGIGAIALLALSI